MDFFSPRLQTFFPSLQKRIKEIPFWVRMGALSLVLLGVWALTCQKAIHRYGEIQSMRQEISLLSSRAVALQAQNNRYRELEKQALQGERDYLKQVVEQMPLLEGEKRRAKILSRQFPDNASLHERISFLDSPQNRMQFEPLDHPFEYRLSHRVQMDLSDLRNVLEALEGGRYDATQGKPFLLIKKFDLLKCDEKGGEKVYSIDMELLQK